MDIKIDVKRQEMFCCKNMDLCVNKELNIEYEIKYYPSVRKYFLLSQDDIGLETELEMQYCSFCGVKLPEHLVEELYSILCEDYGIENPDYRNFEYDIRIPNQFKTSEWWRNLIL